MEKEKPVFSTLLPAGRAQEAGSIGTWKGFLVLGR